MSMGVFGAGVASRMTTQEYRFEDIIISVLATFCIPGYPWLVASLGVFLDVLSVLHVGRSVSFVLQKVFENLDAVGMLLGQEGGGQATVVVPPLGARE